VNKFAKISAIALAGSLSFLIAVPASAENFKIPAGTLSAALDEYSAQAGIPVAMSSQTMGGTRTKGVSGEMSPDQALTQLLSGTGFIVHRSGSTVVILRTSSERSENAQGAARSIQLAAAQAAPASLETVTVTSSKIGGDVQNIPISITALSQEQLTATQTAGGPDLVKQVPNMTFSKTNFSGYTIQLRGIGTQAISVTTDPAVAVAFNDMPFLRNHFFEQEFYDVSQVEVLRGPQGTLYGRNATAGVVNLVSAKPTDQFEAMASADIGNYQSRRFEGMINVPIVDDRVDLRVAGEWTKRQGYSFDSETDQRIDGRDLWSGRITLGFKPTSNLQTYLIWEHFSEDDDRLRSSKQLCKTAPIPATVGGVPVPPFDTNASDISLGGALEPGGFVTQGCEMSSLYSADAFEVPNGYSLQYIKAGELDGGIAPATNPYSETIQSHNLRVIESQIAPHYAAKNDVVEFNADYAVTPSLTFTSQTGFNHDFLYSTEDYNRFNTAPGLFLNPITGATGPFCDPQLGCSTRLLAQDVSDEHAWQANQEFRLTSNFSGPFNFSAGGNYMHYETEENYYVFINALSVYAEDGQGPTGTLTCMTNGGNDNDGYQFNNPFAPQGGARQNQCIGVDPNPLSSVNNQGHNYFLSQNPYVLNSYAMFGETYYNILDDLKLTAGLRWTEDQKHFTDIPSEVGINDLGYPSTGVVNQQWDQFTGRAAVNWTPKLDFTDQTLFYGTYAHGYKAGGANPPGAVFDATVGIEPIHPLTFKPEFIDAFELGSKNTLLDGSLTLNADVFYYNYENYQISEIVDRTAINLNFDAHVKGAEIESSWEPIPGLRFNFAGGWEQTALAKGSQSIDLIDRTAGNPDWTVVKPFPTLASNCILPTYVVAASLAQLGGKGVNEGLGGQLAYTCTYAYFTSGVHLDPVTMCSYVANPTVYCYGLGSVPGYIGFDPLSAPNKGEGIDKNLSGNQLPNAPPFTVSGGAQYTIPLTTDWAGTLRGDYYWQDYSWARVFNDNPYDRLRGYTNLNLTLIFTNQNGWQVMLYDKNVFNTTAITGDFLNSDDSGLTTNIFLTDPKLIGIRVTKNW
jgi:outer membrane receptor protein involved in Fe transport